MRQRIFIWIIVAVFVSCQPHRTYFPKNVKPAEVNIVRFDKDLLAADTPADSVLNNVRCLYNSYPAFMPFFCENIMGIPAADTLAVCEALPDFLNDTLYGFKETNERVKVLYADIDDLMQELETAFGRLKWLYPQAEVPELTFLVSGFNASLFFWEPIEETSGMEQKLRIGVGLDMYLGSDYALYDKVVWNYQKQTMRKESIAGDVVSACLFRMLPYTSDKSRLLENMLYRGKIMYLLSLLLPEEEEYAIMGYTQEQWQWLKRNERAIWQLMIDRRDLFKTEGTVLTSYLDDGPFTAEISQDAPPRIGTWIGWRIAESYMQHNEGVSLQQLMAEADAQKILEYSYYRP